MSSSLSSLADNLAQGLHRDKCKNKSLINKLHDSQRWLVGNQICRLKQRL